MLGTQRAIASGNNSNPANYNKFGQNKNIFVDFLQLFALSGHDSRDWSEYVNVIGAISEPFAREFR